MKHIIYLHIVNKLSIDNDISIALNAPQSLVPWNSFTQGLSSVFKVGWSYLAEQFRQIKRSLAEQFQQIKHSLVEQFRQIKRSMAEQFCQIRRSLAEQWRFNRKKKHVKGGGLVGLVWYRDPPFILFLTSPPCTVSAATTSDSEVNLRGGT